ncbi:hypothetical protein KUH32_12240 [Thalassococcus sp. CAU 1522]|uniref:PepSY domain-containing protein n=1 Tax=Thalassococcus arenae TaxID=2851652 RepID=A0ABS6N955_9RHOB|nr:hypothetical protein [Thalassococcus arenae]MBV2360548.1 hypothetical protein [Thalassococcus arenae]
MPREVVIVTSVLALAAGALGLWLGLAHRPPDEGTVIEAVARAHVERHGGALSDCLARVGQGEVWLEVTCAGFVYRVDRQGRILAPQEPRT